jgi:GxxExxY protein
LATTLLGTSIEVHKTLGLGLLESVYLKCLCYKLKQISVLVEKQKPIPLIFEEVDLECGFRIDLLVENQLVIELKSVDELNDDHLAQNLTYLKLGEYIRVVN